MITLVATLSPPFGSDRVRVADRVAYGAALLADSLGLPVSVDVQLTAEEIPDGALALVGDVPIAGNEVHDPTRTGDRYVEAVISALTSTRQVLATPAVVRAVVERADADPSIPAACWVVQRSIHLAARSDRLDGGLAAVTSWSDAEALLGDALVATGEAPYRVAVGPDLVTADEITELDRLVRWLLWDLFGVLLPPAVVSDPALPSGTVELVVRDVTYPQLPLAEARPGTNWDRLLSLAGSIGGRNLDALITPFLADVIMAMASRAIPVAARLASLRWPRPAFVEALRQTIPALQPRPEDLAFVVERLGLVGPELPCGAGQTVIALGATGALPVRPDQPATAALLDHPAFS